MIIIAARILALAYVLLLTMGLLFQSAPTIIFRALSTSGWLAMLAQGGHFLSMMILGILVTVARPPVPRTGLTALLLSYSLMMEIPHLFLPSRAFEWMDLFQNVSGALVGMTIVEFTSAVMPRRRSLPAPNNALNLLARVHDTDRAG